mmetsp:Transcript_20713/g.43345  ORF Transcript_20713/g.43345 Transcript_20713/m.43345 type:complete len:278 (+) Transcript_20713:961-1794(+)
MRFIPVALRTEWILCMKFIHQSNHYLTRYKQEVSLQSRRKLLLLVRGPPQSARTRLRDRLTSTSLNFKLLKRIRIARCCLPMHRFSWCVCLCLCVCASTRVACSSGGPAPRTLPIPGRHPVRSFVCCPPPPSAVVVAVAFVSLVVLVVLRFRGPQVAVLPQDSFGSPRAGEVLGTALGGKVYHDRCSAVPPEKASLHAPRNSRPVGGTPGASVGPRHHYAGKLRRRRCCRRRCRCCCARALGGTNAALAVGMVGIGVLSRNRIARIIRDRFQQQRSG